MDTRIAISSDGNYVSSHFGRCPFYTLVDIEGNKTVKKLEIGNPRHSPGIIPQYLHNKGADMIVCGGMGQEHQLCLRIWVYR
ncbi:MAG TPA: NifB/NifX family molybdenum-iron cluster-binding protein [Clostridia bacterium]|nr:NifB/NifX family molybdenum-iron cluster-binding protein [Clostridia bacterium]